VLHGTAAEAVDDVAARGQELGGGEAEARRGPGDDDYLLLHNGVKFFAKIQN
jgi:hypothetical protein